MKQLISEAKNNKLFQTLFILAIVVAAIVGFNYMSIGLGSLAVVILTKEQEDAKAFIDDTAGKIADEKIKALEERHAKELKMIEDANNGKIENLQKQHDKLTAIMEQANIGRQSQIKSIGQYIMEGIKENHAKIKSYVLDNQGGFAFKLDEKAVGTMSRGVAGQFGDTWAPTVAPAHEMVHARNVIPVSPTSKDNIKYIQFTAKEGAIAPTAQGATKPAIDWTLTVKNAVVKKIAGNVTVTTEFIDDIEGSSSFLASELPKAYYDVEDFQIFKGDGTGENQLGLFSVATAMTYTGTVTIASNRWDKLARGISQARMTKRGITAAFLSPVDFMELLINKTAAGQYTYPAIYGDAPLMIAGIPIYQHTVITPGTALIGDFASGVRIFEREAPVVKYSYEHANNFTSNLVTVQIEARIALPIYYPETFISINFATA